MANDDHGYVQLATMLAHCAHNPIQATWLSVQLDGCIWPLFSADKLAEKMQQSMLLVVLTCKRSADGARLKCDLGSPVNHNHLLHVLHGSWLFTWCLIAVRCAVHL